MHQLVQLLLLQGTVRIATANTKHPSSRAPCLPAVVNTSPPLPPSPSHPITARNNCALLRSRSGREALHDPIDDDLAVFAANDHDAADARRDVHTLLNQLPDNQRLPIVHTKLEGLSVSEAAAATGMSESAIKVGVHRGMKALAALMTQSLRRAS